MLSNGGGLDLLKRGISPVAGHPHDVTVPDSLSNFGYTGQQAGGDPATLFSQTFLEYSDYPGESTLVPGGDREQSPGLSPHSIRVNAQRGVNGMQTQYGNFLYQVEAKQFPAHYKAMTVAPTSPQNAGLPHTNQQMQ